MLNVTKVIQTHKQSNCSMCNGLVKKINKNALDTLDYIFQPA